MPSFKDTKTLRWAAPIGAIAVVGAAIGSGPVIAAVRGGPTLPPKTAAQLLAAADAARANGKAPAFSGTVIENASLGLPSLPVEGRPGSSSSSLTSLLTGSNTARVWYQDGRHARFALLGTGSETDVILNGQDLWQWSSTQNTATHSVLTDKPGDHARKTPPSAPKVPLTPQQAADKALAQANKDTVVSVDPAARVAGRSAYELVLAPKDSRSLIGQIRIALDGQNYVPLRVQVYPRGSNSAAAQIGFTQVTFSKPDAANFDFKPPAGAKVVQNSGQDKNPADKAHPHGDRRSFGEGWLTVVQVPMSSAQPDAAPGQPGTAPAKPGAAPPKGDRQGGPNGRDTNILLKAAKPVHGSWGSGRLLTTKLVTVLLTDDGRLFAGAVSPSVVEQAAAQK